MAGSRCTKRTLVCFVLLVVVWVLFSAVLATAQGPPFPVTSPSAITNQYKQAQNTWFNNIGIYAKRLFFLLAGIEVIWSLTLLVLERSDFQALAATLVRKIMWIGIFYAFLINAGTWIPAIINSFMAVGEIGGNVGPVSPSVVLGTGLQVASSLFDGASNAGFLTNPGPAFALVFAALITFLAYVGITIQYVLLRVGQGGPFAPLARVAEDHAQGMKQLPEVKKLADDLMLFDNTANGRGVRLVAHFHEGELVKLARSVPKWAQKVFGKEFDKWRSVQDRGHGRTR